MIARRVSELTLELAQSEAMGQQQDPLVALKQRELDLRAMDLQRKSEEAMMNMEIKENEIDERLDIEKMKLENNEDQARERIRIADEKLDIARSKKKIMPLTSKGKKIMKAMKEKYGKKKGESIFYASKNKGKIKGVEKLRRGGGADSGLGGRDRGMGMGGKKLAPRGDSPSRGEGGK